MQSREAFSRLRREHEIDESSGLVADETLRRTGLEK